MGTLTRLKQLIHSISDISLMGFSPLYVKAANSNELSAGSFFKYTEKISDRQLVIMLTLRILISLPRRIWDLDRFFLLMLLMATSQSIFFMTKKEQDNRKKWLNSNIMFLFLLKNNLITTLVHLCIHFPRI